MNFNKIKLPNMRRITKRIPEILLILILLLISILSFKSGMYLLSNDNYSPELNPTLSVSRYIESPAWRSYRVLGFASESEQADVFRSLVFELFDVFLDNWILSQLFYLFCLFIGSLSVAYLIRELLKNSKLKKYSNWGFLIGGVTYFTTLWTMWLFYQTIAPYITNFGFLPLLLLGIYWYSKENSFKNLLLIFFFSILFTSTSVIATLFIVDFIFILLFTIFVNFLSRYGRRKEIKNVIITIGIFLLTQVFWILPFIHYTLSSSSHIVDSYTNRTITSSVIDLETDMQSLTNSARLYNRTLFEMDGEDYLFPMADLFQIYDFYKVLGLIPVFFSLLALVFGIAKRNYKLLFWGIIGITALFLIKVLNPPLAIIFEWLQNNIPLFKQVFRWPFSKVGQIYVMCITVLSTFGVIYLLQFFTSFFGKKIVRKIFVIMSLLLYCIFQLVYSEYILRGDIFSDRSLVNLPNEYFKLNEYLVENDQTGRIYYAPPSNNNYFRKYEWGFWGSQFISYLLPNPVMDMSSAVGSKVGEEALLKISNVVRSRNKEEFLTLMHRYDVRYVLFDSNVEMNGYSFDIEKEETKALLLDYELVWSSENLFLFKVPLSTEKLFSESLSVIEDRDIFVKDTPQFPTLSPLDINMQNLRLEGSDIVGEFTYKGYSTYMYSNLTEDMLNVLPSRVEYRNKVLSVYPSYPYVEGDVSVRPNRSYSADADYFVVGNTALGKQSAIEGITVEDTFGSTLVAYGFSGTDFKSIDMIPLLTQAKGSDCSGGEVIESTFVTPQEISSGFMIKGTTESPCVYTGIPIDSNERNILKVRINWESNPNNYPGYCIYSENRKRCLNKEKFLSSKSAYGEVELLLDTVIEKGEKISLILYSINIAKEFSTESIFRNVTIQYIPLTTPLSVQSSSEEWIPKDVFLDDDNLYSVHIPVVVGNMGYLYDGSKLSYSIWEPNRLDSESKEFEVSSENGMHQEIEDDYINQTANLFVTNPNSKYLVYWKGENISNIPASLCLIYDKEEKCWFQDMLASSSQSSYLNIINGSQNEKVLNVIYGSSSYKLTTENILKEFAFMKYPSAWNSFMYIQNSPKEFKEVEMKNVFNSPNSTFYKVKKEEIKDIQGSILVSIPQAKSSGWIAISRNGILPSILGKDTRVSINDWKQGWDISNVNFDSITVIYWPNLLSYFGYILILLTFVYLTIKFIEERKYGKK